MSSEKKIGRANKASRRACRAVLESDVGVDGAPQFNVEAAGGSWNGFPNYRATLAEWNAIQARLWKLGEHEVDMLDLQADEDGWVDLGGGAFVSLSEIDADTPPTCCGRIMSLAVDDGESSTWSCERCYRVRELALPDHSDHGGDLCHDDGSGACAECGVGLDACDTCDGVGYHREGCTDAG